MPALTVCNRALINSSKSKACCIGSRSRFHGYLVFIWIIVDIAPKVVHRKIAVARRIGYKRGVKTSRSIWSRCSLKPIKNSVLFSLIKRMNWKHGSVGSGKWCSMLTLNKFSVLILHFGTYSIKQRPETLHLKSCLRSWWCLLF